MKDGAVLYCRVSTDDQVGNNSLPIQLKDCIKKAEELECKVLKEFIEEGESGAKMERLQKRMLGTLEVPPMITLSKIPITDSSKLVAPRRIELLLPG